MNVLLTIGGLQRTRAMAKVLFETVLMAVLVYVGFLIYFVAAPQNQLQGAPMTARADQEYTVQHNLLRRRYLVHLPAGYDRTKKYPVVIALHGGMARSELQRDMSKMNPVADRHGFIVVYPDGTGRTRLLTFNAGSCCGFAANRGVDDVGFIRRLIVQELPSKFSIDPDRVYATGFSNGAMLCYRLACELSDLIAAIGPVAGDLGVEGPLPKRPVPVIHIHGRHDNNVPLAGGVGSNAFQPVPHRSIPETIAWWVKANHCNPRPIEEVEKHYILKRYEPAPGSEGAPVWFYLLPEGGHAWPGGADLSAHLKTGNLVAEVDASTLIWKFFEQHSLASPATSGK
jgi:polyhydroxybutyrate depolymerase